MEALSRMPFTAQKDIFKQLVEYTDSHRLTKEEWEAYENSLWIARDNMACMAAAEREAREKGMAEGIEEERKKGREEGREEGRAEEKAETAKRLLGMGLSIEQVSKGLDLSIEDTKKLISNRT